MKKKLSAQYLNSNLDAGRYYDDNGTGLNIHVRKSGSKNWSQRGMASVHERMDSF